VIGRFVPPDSAELSEVTGLYGERPPAPPVRVVASGPLCIVVETILVHKRSVARVRHTFHRYHPHIDFDVLLNFGERRRAVQLELSTTLTDDSYEAEIPHATVTRTRNGGEEPVGRWVMVGGNGNAMCLVNDGPGGVEITDDWIRQTLVRSPVYCSGQDSVDPHYLGEHMDLGEHRYRFRLLFGARDDVVAQRQLGADDLSLPFSYHCSVPLGPSRAPGLAAGAQPFVLTHTDGYGVHLEAMKASEDGTALVVRLAERAGSPAVVRVEAAGVEPLSLAFRPFEMKTLRCDLDVRTESKRSWAECDLLERSGG
jgi:alpha-mannosidase